MHDGPSNGQAQTAAMLTVPVLAGLVAAEQWLEQRKHIGIVNAGRAVVHGQCEDAAIAVAGHGNAAAGVGITQAVN